MRALYGEHDHLWHAAFAPPQLRKRRVQPVAEAEDACSQRGVDRHQVGSVEERHKCERGVARQRHDGVGSHVRLERRAEAAEVRELAIASYSRSRFEAATTWIHAEVAGRIRLRAGHLCLALHQLRLRARRVLLRVVSQVFAVTDKSW